MAKQQRKKTSAKKSAGSVSRRSFLHGVIAASAAAGVSALPAGASVTSAAAGASASGEALQVLSAEQNRVLTAVLNRLVPRDGEMPGAGDVGISRFIDGVLAEAPHMRQPILGIVGEVALAGEQALGNGAELDGVLRRIEASRKDSFNVLLQATYTGYYSHPDVLRGIGWVPPGQEADASESFDVALLEDVVQRGARYRNV